MKRKIMSDIHIPYISLLFHLAADVTRKIAGRDKRTLENQLNLAPRLSSILKFEGKSVNSHGY